MKLCILDNDDLDPAAVPIWGSYATMFERLLRDAGFQGDVEAFSARHAQYPDSFDAYGQPCRCVFKRALGGGFVLAC